MQQPAEDGSRQPAPVYRQNTIPLHLRSFRQLAAEGLRPAQISKPDGVYARKGVGWVTLYDRRLARPHICTSKMQPSGALILARKRERYTCRSCGRFVNGSRWIRTIQATGGVCALCQQAEGKS